MDWRESGSWGTLEVLRQDPLAAATTMHSQDIQDALHRSFDPDVRNRRTALLELCPCHVRTDVDRVWDRILQMRDDPEPSVRSIVLHSLCDGSPSSRRREVVAALETLAHDPDRALRRRARSTLARYRRTGKITEK